MTRSPVQVEALACAGDFLNRGRNALFSHKKENKKLFFAENLTKPENLAMLCV